MKVAPLPARVMITGGDGFVAPYAVRAIKKLLPNCEILITARNRPKVPRYCTFEKCDIRNTNQVQSVISKFLPTHVLHLAGIASRAAAEADVKSSWATNVLATVELARTLKANCNGSTFIFISSSQVYSFDVGSPISESGSIEPIGVYASTKFAAEVALMQLPSNAFRVIIFRPFNHTGPGQAPSYAFSSFVEQVVQFETGNRLQPLLTGNIDVERDVVDVRDVARAYALSIRNSSQLSRLEVFNIASGSALKLSTFLADLRALAHVPFEVRQEPSLVRHNEPARVVGNASRARELLDWKPRIPISKTMVDMLKLARSKGRSSL